MTPPDNTPPPTVFESLWTPDVIRQILDEYLMDRTDFICEASVRFKTIWDLYKEKLRELVFEFNPEEKLHFTSTCTWCLIYCPLGGSHRQARIDFLDHEIQRLSPHA